MHEKERAAATAECAPVRPIPIRATPAFHRVATVSSATPSVGVLRYVGVMRQYTNGFIGELKLSRHLLVYLEIRA